MRRVESEGRGRGRERERKREREREREKVLNQSCRHLSTKSTDSCNAPENL